MLDGVEQIKGGPDLTDTGCSIAAVPESGDSVARILPGNSLDSVEQIFSAG